MGVTGLWRLIEPAGKPVPIETLENKVLAVDISIWLHQMVKGFQDAKGAPMPNAHLMGLFQRLCKILYYRIKPVFVFDGVYPELKKETIAKRHESKARMNTESERIQREIMVILGKKTALGSLLGKQPSPKKMRPITDDQEDIFNLPALPENDLAETLSNSDSDSETDDEAGPTIDLHTVDLESEEIKNLPVREKYNLLTDLKETRKMNSWGKLNQLPKKSESFADYQMGRLLKRRKLQECIKETESLMDGNCLSLNELELMLNDQGVETKYDDLPTKRIASDDTTRYFLIKDIKQAIEDAKRREEINKNASTSDINKNASTSELEGNITEQADTDTFDKNHSNAAKADTSWTDVSTSSQENSTFLVDSDQFSDDDMSNDDSCRAEIEKLSTVRDFMIQNTDFTHKSIKDIISKSTTKKQKSESKINEILAELEKSFSNVEKREPVQKASDCTLSSTDTDDETSTKLSTESAVKSETNNCKTKKLTPIIQNVLTPTTSVAASSEDCEIFNDDMDEELRKAIQMSLECEQQPAKQTKLIENAELNVGSQNITSDTESDSDSFIEVLDEKKSIVQLTVNMVDKIDDDIFADVFEHKLEETDMVLASTNNPKSLFNIENTKYLNETLARDDEFSSIYKGNENEIASSNTGVAVDNQSNSKTISKPSEKHRIPEELSETCITNKNRNCKVKFKLGETNIENTSDTQCAMNNKLEASEKSTDFNKDPIYTNEEICELKNILEQQQEDLLQEKRKLDRMGANISEQMTSEVQELLRIFGIPYIVAPMEAEAQCAFLEMAKLTDGTITDDSDIWLFGGRTVYKNFFNQKKHVVQFLAEKIERSFRLNREQLILLALLVGSDYTTGVSGVGPVTAMEILASFPGTKQKYDQDQADMNRKCQSLVKGLEEFKKWVHSGRRTDDSSLRRKLKNVKIGNDFPSLRVVQAYLEPNVEKSKDNFTWGVPDITVLRDYTRTKFGWNQNKLDDIINPVLKRFQNKQSQKSLQDYFQRKVQFQPMEDHVSKRVKAAIDLMNPNAESSQKIESQAKLLKNRKSKTKRPTDPMPSPSEVPQQILETPVEPLKAHDKKKKRPAKAILTDAISTTCSELALTSELPLKASLDLRNDEISNMKFKIPKLERSTEIIPQKEKRSQAILENKLKAIELYRTSRIDTKRNKKKRVWPKAKEKADLSESDSE